MTHRTILRLTLLLAIVAASSAALWYWDPSFLQSLTGHASRGSAWGPAVLIGVWLVAPLFFIPGGPITIASGALFGPLWGTVYSLIGATAGGTLAFLVARYLAADWTERHAQGRLAQLKAGVEEEGWRFVAFVRLVPLFPFNLLNYLLGLTRIPLATYVATTFICMLPGAAGFAYLGHAGREALGGSQDWVRTGATALGVAAGLVLLPWMVRRWKQGRTVKPRTVAKWMRDGRDFQLVDVRSMEEYGGPEGHIATSLLIPIDALEHQLKEFGLRKDCPIVVL